MQKFILLFYLFLVCSHAHGQNQKAVDSLTRLYHQTKYDTVKINVLFEIMEAYRTHADTTLMLAQKTLQMSEKNAYRHGIAHSLYNLGMGHYLKDNHKLSFEYYQKTLEFTDGNYDCSLLVNVFNNLAALYDLQGYYPLALEYYQKALSCAEKIQDKIRSATNLANIGNTYKNLGNYPTAIDYYLKGLKIFEEFKKPKSTAYIYNNLGIAYLDQDNLPTARDYFLKSIELREKTKDKKGLASSLNNLGNLYLKQSNPQEALEQFKKSLVLYEETNDTRGQAISLNNLGDIHNQLFKHQEAITYYQKALSINEKNKNKGGVAYSLLGLARTELASKKYEEGIIYAQKSLAIAREIKGLAEIKNAYRNLFILHREKGDYVKALEYHQRFADVKDSIFNEKNAKTITNLEAKAEIDRKQREIELLHKNKLLDEKTKETLQKDLKMQQIEAERQRTARLAIEKQAEADQLIAEARQEKDKHKQDSLHTLAQKIQLEADNLKAKEKQLEAENKARQLEIIKERAESKATQLEFIKERDARLFQLYLLYLALGAFLVVTVLAYFIYRAQQKEKKAKELITEQKEEIAQQKEEINQQRDSLELQTQELEAANQTKNKLFAILGHDLRSPIGSLESMLNLMDMGMLSQDEFQHFVPLFHKNVKNMQNTLENLLQWSISQMKGISANPSMLNLTEIIEEKVQLFSEVAKAKNIRITTQFDTKMSAWADPNHVRLLLRNLLNNAIKFTPNDGNINITAYQKDSYIVLSVIDSGVGMSEEQMGRLFKKNQTFTTYGTNGEKGTGLGLQLCREIAVKNGGTIWASSEQGKGSSFNFTLPSIQK